MMEIIPSYLSCKRAEFSFNKMSYSLGRTIIYKICFTTFSSAKMKQNSNLVTKIYTLKSAI